MLMKTEKSNQNIPLIRSALPISKTPQIIQLILNRPRLEGEKVEIIARFEDDLPVLFFVRHSCEGRNPGFPVKNGPHSLI
jgi:hypothetical protein